MAIGSLALVAVLSVGLWARCNVGVPRPNHVVRDRVLRERGIVIYTPDDAPRALVLFFGNDVGFWRPHHELAADLAGQGYAVAGVDIRPLLAALPETHPARDSAYATAVRDLVSRVRRELALDSVPLIIGGHSLGAELALWTAANGGVRGIVGTLALSPGNRSHLRVSASDILMTSEPQGPDSFGVAAQVAAATRTGQRVAVVRGANDKFRSADSSLFAAGGESLRRFSVPFAAHSLRDLTLARYVIRDAMRWLLEPRPR
jgi:pimeloyl-ACP methyl ester carboxylesterase